MGSRSKFFVAVFSFFLLLSLTIHLFDARPVLGQGKQPLLAQENLIAWCIVPFDSKKRAPAERLAMLKQLKLSQYAYDWRHEHLDSFAEEIKLAKQNKIFIAAVWMWIEDNADQPGKLSDDNQRLLKIIQEEGLVSQLWVGFNSSYFAAESDEDKVRRGADMLRYIKEAAGTSCSGIGLYNHGDWFGDPENQITILKSLNDPFYGIIYNFHHAHSQIDRFPALLKEMLPYLWTVNIDGMKKDGPQILPVGSGTSERGMIETLIKSGFKGTIGILGHKDDEDVAIVLRRNLDGLRQLEKSL
jgi:hypothetical protein